MQEQLIGQILGGGAGALTAALLLVIVLLVTGKIVPGYMYKALEAKLSRYEELAFKAMALAERASKDGA